MELWLSGKQQFFLDPRYTQCGAWPGVGTLLLGPKSINRVSPHTACAPEPQLPTRCGRGLSHTQCQPTHFPGLERWLSSYEHTLFLQRTENSSPAPNTKVKPLTTACYSSCRESDAVFWPLQACTHVNKPIFTHIYKHQTANSTAVTCWSLSPKGPSESLVWTALLL